MYFVIKINNVVQFELDFNIIDTKDAKDFKGYNLNFKQITTDSSSFGL
jgi:hypothetical protein